MMAGWVIGIGTLAPASGQVPGTKNRYTPYSPVRNITEGISWPKGQALPTFSTPAATLDSIMVQELSKDEQLTFSALQGIVNRKQPRIYLLDARTEEGSTTWAETATAGLGKRNLFDRNTKYDLLAKYAKESAGLVLYDLSVSPHYRNLAFTAAAVSHALPVSAEVYQEMKAKGIDLPVVEDLTKLKDDSTVAIYQYMYDHYWQKCDKRLLVSARPGDVRGGGDFHHTRDMAAATGSAVVWLDTLIPAEKEMMRKFLGDMKAGEAVVLGWFTSERSGITTLSEFGIGTLAADFYSSGSIYSGTDHKILIPAVPKMPELETKVYVSIFISDGDNIQYTQHAMRKVWDRTIGLRGKIPLNWTIAPGLVDIGPALMNYYYTTATPNDCFVTGPSGMGYMMPVNTLTEPGAPVGVYLKDPARMDGYAKLAETYLQRSGLRVMTIWDDATPMQRASYEKNCRHLYGATVQNFKDVPSVEGGVENKRVRFDKLVIPYAGSYDHINGSLTSEIKHWDGKEPLFLSYQANIWADLKPEKLVELHDNLTRQFPGKVEFVRADHYFNLSNESAGIPYNLSLSQKTTVRASDTETSADLALDGTPTTLWTSSKPKPWLGLDFGSPHRINRYVIRHAGDSGADASQNTRDYAVQASLDGKSWKTIDVCKGNKANVSDVDFEPVSARYFKILINQAGSDSIARIADVEVYGVK